MVESVRESATMKLLWWQTKAKDMAPRPENTVEGRMIDDPATEKKPPLDARDS